MRRHHWLLMLAGIIVAASCATPASRVEPPVLQPKWQDTGTPSLAAL